MAPGDSRPGDTVGMATVPTKEVVAPVDETTTNTPRVDTKVGGAYCNEILCITLVLVCLQQSKKLL